MVLLFLNLQQAPITSELIGNAELGGYGKRMAQDQGRRLQPPIWGTRLASDGFRFWVGGGPCNLRPRMPWLSGSRWSSTFQSSQAAFAACEMVGAGSQLPLYTEMTDLRTKCRQSLELMRLRTGSHTYWPLLGPAQWTFWLRVCLRDLKLRQEFGDN